MENNPPPRKFISKDEIDEEIKIRRRAIIFGFFTLVLIFLIIFWGVPLLIKFAVLLGNLKSQSEPAKVEDTIPPLPPQFSFVPEATNSATISLSGFAEKGARLEIYLNNNLLTETKTGDDGQFYLEKVSLKKGENTIFAYAYDKAGNKSEASKKIETVFDDEPPSLEIDSPPEKETVYEQRLEIKGKTDPEGVKLTIDDHVVLIEKEGKFSYSLDLAEGKNEIKVVAEDIAGNKTEKTLIINYQP